MDPVSSAVFKLTIAILKIIYKFISGKAYIFLKDRTIIRYSLIGLTIIIFIVCLLLILFNSFKGISQILKDLFGLDSYKYINSLNIDLEANFNKLYLPEFIISSAGLGSLIFILLYIISYEKYLKESTTNPTDPTDPTNPTDTTKRDLGIATIGAVGTIGASGALNGTMNSISSFFSNIL